MSEKQEKKTFLLEIVPIGYKTIENVDYFT